MSLLLPTWQNNFDTSSIITKFEYEESIKNSIPSELLRLQKLTEKFTCQLHWELSTTLTSNHMLALVAMSNTLMSMTSASFIPENERNKKLHK